MWTVEMYESDKGEIPVKVFLDSLDKKMRSRALTELRLLQDMGNTIREPYSKHLRDGIFELRIQAAGDISRIFYFFYVGRKIVLTNGFIKKSQKTPRSEIDRAKKYKADYERRHRSDP